jgi:integrase
MARITERLSPTQVKNAQPPKGKDSAFIPDGGNLFLQCTRGTDGSISRSWVFKYQFLHRRREMGMGPLRTVSLKQARKRAAEYREMLLDLRDPLEERQAQRRALLAERAKATTFEELARQYFELHADGWKSRVHRQQWISSMQKYAFPSLGRLAPQAIDQAMIFKLIEPLWKRVPTTGSRVLQRIERTLDFATSKGFRSGENPARHVLEGLPKLAKVAKVEHYPALPYPEMPVLMAELASLDNRTRRALRFLILTACRTAEVTGARWSEIDLATKVWTVPGERMKSGVEHRVPLSDEAIAVIADLPREGELIFGLISQLGRTVTRSIRAGITVHGFRSSFRQWATERTNYPDHVIEQVLAHQVGSEVLKAYKRQAEPFERRRPLMQDWAKFCTTPTSASDARSVVLPFRS